VLDDVEVDPVTVMGSHGVVAPLGSRLGVDVMATVGAGHDRWGDAFAVGADDGEVDTDRGVATPLDLQQFGVVDLQRDTPQAGGQLNRLDDGRIREAHCAFTVSDFWQPEGTLVMRGASN
jgi:hypothetical protein